VSRPGLWERLDGPARVTVVSAPPGSGKTVLLRSWIGEAGLGERAAWVLVGRDERDAQRFWLSVLAALRQTAPDLLERRARQRTAHAALIAQILDLLAGPGGCGGMASPRLAEPLSQSELRVLRYLPTHLSAPEIASELSVSLSTVKTHMRNLYAKLGGHSRAEAVERARALGLLAPSAHL
jgi:LuxR family maltose regulon positive regulatory protein